MNTRHSFWQPLVVALIFTLTPAALLYGQAAPTEESEVRDLSETPIRKVGASIHFNTPGWNLQDRKASGPAVAIHFNGPAAPLAQVGKTVEAGLIRMNPEVQGEWKWANAQRLEFFPAAGWLPPGNYQFQARDGLLADDCQLAENTHFDQFRTAPKLTGSFQDRNYHIDPETPGLQQLVTRVDFSQPVSLEEARRQFSVTSVTGIEIFQAGSQPQVLPEPEDPRRFYLRSPLMKPGEKEDLILFNFAAGMKPVTGGKPTEEEIQTKLTAYSRDSLFFIDSVGSMLRKTADGEPEQALLVQLSIPAIPASIAKSVEAWKLPPEERDENGRWKSWTKENVGDEVLAKSKKLELELITSPGAPPMEQGLAFRVPQQPGAKVFLKVPKETAGPGGFVTPEDYREVTTLVPIPRETSVMGNGGLLALNGERKISVQSRGIDHLRHTVARVKADQINHLVSQTRGSFVSPSFYGGLGFENISEYEQSVQAIARQGEYAVNYSSFDFAPLVDGAKSGRGLFYLTVEGVRPRTTDDGEVAKESPDREWIALTPEGSRHYGYSHRSDSDISYPPGDRLRDGRFILVTDLGLIMKEAADGSRAIFVQSFSARGPVDGVKISVLAKNGKVLKTATTDAAGMAVIASLRGLERELTPVALVARKGDDLAFIPWAKSERLIDSSRYDVGGVNYSDASALTASLFTERGIYRPGEEIHVGGIVRQRDWTGELAGLPVELVVVNAKRDVAGRYPLKLDQGGVFSFTFPTAESAPTGPWWISLERPKSEDSAMRRESLYLGDTVVRVEEFQPDRLKIKAKFVPDAGDGWHSPDGLAVAVQLDTLFGMAAANRRVAAKLHLTPESPYFAKWPGWRFGLSNNNRHDSREITLTDAATDENGRAKLTLDMEAHTAPMLRARVELEGFEADGGRGVRTSLSTLVSPQAYLIGFKAERGLSYLDGRDPVPVEVIAIGRDGKPVAAADLTRVLIQTKHVSVLTKQNNGSLAYESQKRDETIETVKVSLPDKPQALTLPLNTPGNFRYEFRNAAGQALCSIPFSVAGKGDATKNLERSGELEINFADKKWLPGEELEFSLTTPFIGAGLITIERDSVLVSKWFKCDSKATVQTIQLPDHIEGGVYLSVVMARALDSPDVFLNPLASGIMPITAARGDREMAVTLDAVERVRPGERLAIGYQAPKNGKVVIWAVDEGIHLVSSYQPPDPLLRLLPTAALEVETYQLMDVLMPEFSLLRKALAIGGDGGEGAGTAIPELKMGLNPFKRRRDAPVVFWSGFVNAGPDRQEVFYDVPEYFAGRLKIMAVAVSDDSVGVGEAQTIVKGDFVLQATTPLFVVPGDEFTASVTVANQLEGDTATDQVKVKVETLGGVEILEVVPESHTIPVGKEVTVGYRCRATDLLGNGELTFTASSGTSQQVTRSSFSVRPGVARAAKVQSGWFRNGSHDVAVNHPMFSELAERQAVVSTTPLGLVHGLSAYLKEYPHGCTEQITSRAFPWLVLKDDANFGLDQEDAAKAVADIMNQLSRRQGPNGGFGWWSAYSPEGFDYVTVYVGHFLTECKSSGFEVPARLYQATMRRLRYMADTEVVKPTGDSPYRYEQTRWQAEMRAAAIYLLTRNEEVTTNYALKLQDFMEANVPSELWHRDSTAVWLASIWRMLKKETAAMQLLDAHRAEVKKPLPQYWRYGYYFYQSRLTREATTFTVLCRHFPEIAKNLSYDEMKPLTEMIEQGDFHTLSAAWSIQALKAYADLSKDSGVKAGIASVRGDQVEVLAEPAMGQLNVNVPEGMVRFFFADGSPQGLGAWYQTIEKGFAKELPAEAGGHHIEIRRELLDADGQPVAHGKLGETIFAKLTIRNLTKTELPNLAITEMLPGGFELAPPGEKDSLRPGLATRQGTDYIDVREDRALIYLGLRPEGSLSLQYALRPTCPGNYIVPPPYAEDMYEAKVRANGEGGKLMVLPRN
jgi:alpha-2-macroglobulin